jgi:hypothetical protein
MRFPAALHIAIFGATVAAGQALPPTPPTAQVGEIKFTAEPPAKAPAPEQRAKVTFTSGSLSIAADNSSLNQILRDISRLTGMKITGGVAEERVYGSFGPGDTSAVLSALLSGTGSNMMLIFNAQRAPSELVLTPRGGGPTPPSPSAVAGDGRDDEDLPPQMRQHISRPEMRQPPPNPPAASPAAPPAAPPSSAPDTTQEVSPNGVSTPEQIYQQLLANQKKKQQQTPPQ